MDYTILTINKQKYYTTFGHLTANDKANIKELIMILEVHQSAFINTSKTNWHAFINADYYHISKNFNNKTETIRLHKNLEGINGDIEVEARRQKENRLKKMVSYVVANNWI